VIWGCVCAVWFQRCAGFFLCAWCGVLGLEEFLVLGMCGVLYVGVCVL